MQDNLQNTPNIFYLKNVLYFLSQSLSRLRQQWVNLEYVVVTSLQYSWIVLNNEWEQLSSMYERWDQKTNFTFLIKYLLL